MKEKRSLYNMAIGLISQALMLATSILLPRLILINMGSEANGLLNSVNQALVYLGLLEAGVGTVTIQALYRPVSENNRESVCCILAATRKYYLRTGAIFMAATAALSVIYPLLVETELSTGTVMLVILFSGSGSALTYFINGKYALLLQAEGKGYIRTALSTTIHILLSLAKVVLLTCGYDVAVIQATYFGAMLIQSSCEYLYIKRNYSWLNLNVPPDTAAIGQKNSVLIHQFCGLIFNNTDTLLLTFSWGLKYVSVYAIYNLVFSQLSNIVVTGTSSVMFALGQSYQTDSDRFQKEYNVYELGMFMITFVLASIASVLITPFIKLYTAGVTDVEYLNVWYPPLFTMVFILGNLRGPAQTSITVAGHFRKTTNRAIIEMVINLVVSLVMLPKFGLVGVLTGTVAALLYRTNDMIIYSSHNIHYQKLSKTYRRIVRNLLLCLVYIVVGIAVPPDIASFASFVVWGIGLTMLTVVVFFMVNILCEKEMRDILIILCKKFSCRQNM